MIKSRGWQALLLVLFTVSLAFVWWRPYFQNAGGGFDESMLLVYPELILHGKLPYLDFTTFYGPGNIWVLAAFYKVFGVSLTSERIVALIYRCFILLAFGWLGRRLAPGLSWLFVIVGVIAVSFLRLEAIAWIPACTLGLLSLLIGCSEATNLTTRRRRLFFSGLAAGLTLVFRQDLGPALILGSLPMLLSWTWPHRKIWLLGAAGGLLPLVFITLCTSWQAVWLNLFYFPVILSSPGRNIPFSTLDPSRQYLVLALLFLMICNLLTAAWSFLTKENHARLYLAAALFSLGMTHQLLQRYDLGHIGMGALVTVPLFIATLLRWLRAIVCRPVWGVPALVCVLAFLVIYPPPTLYGKVVPANLPYILGTLKFETYDITNGGRSFPTQNRSAQKAFAAIVDYLNTNSLPGQTVYVAQGEIRRAYLNDIFLYHLLMPRLQPGTYHIESEPLVTNAPNSGLDRQLLECDWIVLNSVWDKVPEPNRGQEIGFDGPAQVLASRFTLVFRSDPLTVYRNNRLGPQRP